jgi:hypothetical protein
MSFVPFLSKQMLLTVCQWKIIVMMDDRFFFGLKEVVSFAIQNPLLFKNLRKKDTMNERKLDVC